MQVVFSDENYVYYCSDDQYFRSMHAQSDVEQIDHSDLYEAYRRHRGPITRSQTKFAHMHMQLCDCMASVGGRVAIHRVLGRWSSGDKLWYLQHLPRQIQ